MHPSVLVTRSVAGLSALALSCVGFVAVPGVANATGCTTVNLVSLDVDLTDTLGPLDAGTTYCLHIVDGVLVDADGFVDWVTTANDSGRPDSEQSVMAGWVQDDATLVWTVPTPRHGLADPAISMTSFTEVPVRVAYSWDLVGPAAPTGLAAEATGMTTAHVTWSAAAAGSFAVAAYDVWYRVAGTGDYALFATTTDLSLDLTGLAHATAYDVKVKARDIDDRASAFSSSASVTTDAPVAPQAPTGLTAVAGGTNSVDLTWSSVAEATFPLAGYDVYVRTAGAQDWALFGRADATATTVDGLNANADYEFSVLACDTDDNCSDRSQPADATTDAISPLISTPAAILTGQSVVFAVSHLSGAAVVEAGDLAEGVAGLDVDGLTVTVTTVHGFSGVLTQPLIVTDEGSQVAVDAVVTVNPDAASRAAYKPLSATSARITWTSGAGATRATVRVNGKSVCTTSATTCTVRSLLGPASVVTVTESGHDATSATPVRAAYSASKVPLGTSHFVGDSAVLTSASVKALRTLSSRIAAAGITRLTVHGYTAAQTRATRTPGQLRLSQLRAHAVSDALVAMLDARGLHVRITLVAEGGAHPIASNATYTGRTENRRAEVVIG